MKTADNLARSLAAGFRDALKGLNFLSESTGDTFSVGALGPIRKFDRRGSDFAATVHLRVAENGKRYRVTIAVYEDREQHAQETEVAA